MKQAIKMTFIVILLLVISFRVLVAYIKYSAEKIVTEQELNRIVNQIKTAPPLPDNFKVTYARVYDGVFNRNFISALIKSLFSKSADQCPSDRVAGEFWFFFARPSHTFQRSLHRLGLIWLLEDRVSQEKCFEYYTSRLDFTSNVVGLHAAASCFYHQPLDSLGIDEQLGLILMINNPVLYNPVRDLKERGLGIKKLKKKMNH